jgi:outer membrane lipoprotein SlyB
VVQSIDLVRVDSASSGVGIGTIAGAVVGGIIGHQVGSGNGNTAATVLGAAGGAYAGRELEKRNQPQIDAYKLTIRLRDGTYQTVTQTTNADIRVGDRVRIDNGVAQRY